MTQAHRRMALVAVVLVGVLVGAHRVRAAPDVGSAARAAGSLLVHPTDVAVDAHGNVYVALMASDHIIKLSPRGRVVATLGRPGPGTDQPKGITVDRQGNIYVAGSTDGGDGNGIAKLSPSGKRLAYIGTAGGGPGQFEGPQDVAIDAQGNLYVADSNNNRVQKLSPTGKPLGQWTGGGGDYIGLGFPNGIALDRRGNIYVADHRGGGVLKLSPRGTRLAFWTLPASVIGDQADGGSSVGDVAVDAHGNVYSASEGTDQKGGLVRRTPSGKVVAFWPQFVNEGNIAVDAQGNIYGIDNGSTGVFKISPAGKLLATWK